MKPTSLAASIALSSALSFFSATAQEADSEARTLAENQNRAYVEAFEKGDTEALAALFTEDAQYGTDSGEIIAGRELIQSRAGDFFEKSKNSKLKITVEAARFLTPDVLVENGFAVTVVDKAEPGTTIYRATHVKLDDAWLIAELHESPPPPADPAAEALASLDWMIGKWIASGDDWSATSKGMWTLNGRFLARTFSINRDGETDAFESAEVIGYDNINGTIRSWIFDSEGGFGQATWTRDGNKWLAQARSTLPDGSESTAEHVYTVIEDGRISVKSINRMVDGQALPNTDLVDVTRTED
jgi:uncharacterized protein (TIGR02246 family)